MKSIIVSIRPKWVEKIISGKKTIEVRKSAPKENPFRVYMYMTKDCKNMHDCGKVVGEFICDNIIKWEYLPDCIFTDLKMYYISCADGISTCLSYSDIEDYGGGKTLYGWHISDLKIYDKPKELSEFRPICKFEGKDLICNLCPNHEYNGGLFFECRRKVTRPPQSWGYVEELGDNNV